MIKQEERFEYKGFPCVVLFQSMGFRCGYVGLSINNQYYGSDCDSIPIECHCGLTYADSLLFGQNDIDTWWIGFDCGHCCDGFDLEKIKEYFGDNPETMRTMSYMKSYHELVNQDHDFRTLKYCKEECKKIVDQILEE